MLLFFGFLVVFFSFFLVVWFSSSCFGFSRLFVGVNKPNNGLRGPATFEPKLAMGSWVRFGLVLSLGIDTSSASGMKHWESERKFWQYQI